MSSSETEYEKLFTKFYSDYFKFRSGKKSQLRCPGCQSEKRFIFSDDKLVYSCGPSSDPKCGKQYTIVLPKYIHYRTLRETYEKNINGSLEYHKNDILQYDLSELSQKMDVQRELETQNKLIKESSDDLKRLIDDYKKSNDLDKYIDDLETLSEKRYKNSIEKSKIMKSLNEDDLSEPEKISLRKKYAVCIKENNDFIEMIKILNRVDNDYIMIKNSEMTIHKNLDEKSEKPNKSDKQKKQNCSKAHPPPPCPGGKEVPEGKDCCYNIKGKTSPKKESPKIKKKCSKAHPPPPCPEGKEVPEGKDCCYNVKGKTSPKKDTPKSETPKKYSYDEQLKILIEYYSKVDSNKTESDIKRILDNRRPKGKPKGTRIPTEPWLELCEKLNKKYNDHPLK